MNELTETESIFEEAKSIMYQSDQGKNLTDVVAVLSGNIIKLSATSIELCRFVSFILLLYT